MKGFGRLLDGEACEETEFDDAALLRVEFLKVVQRVVQSDELQAPVAGRVEVLVETQDDGAAAAFFAMRGTRVIDQDAPHDPSTDCEKMSAVLPVCVFLPHQLQISFVDKRGAVEGVILPLTPQLPVGDLAQLRVDQRSELVDCGGISGSPRFEQFCDFSGSHVIELRLC